MATNKTEFLNLNDWVGTDPFKREEINANFRTLDAKAKEHKDSIDSITSNMAQIANLTDHTITYSYYSDGNIQTVTEKDSSNNVIQTVTYTYNASGDVSISATVKNGKTYTTTYNYDANGNITSTSNVIS